MKLVAINSKDGYELGYTPNNLRAIRQKHGLTQQQAAELIADGEASYRSVCNWETDLESPSHRDMPLAKWRKLLSALSE